jgi:hypothetical protein
MVFFEMVQFLGDGGLGYVRRGWVIELICRKVLKKKGMDKIE